MEKSSHSAYSIHRQGIRFARKPSWLLCKTLSPRLLFLAKRNTVPSHCTISFCYSISIVDSVSRNFVPPPRGGLLHVTPFDPMVITLKHSYRKDRALNTTSYRSSWNVNSGRRLLARVLYGKPARFELYPFECPQSPWYYARWWKFQCCKQTARCSGVSTVQAGRGKLARGRLLRRSKWTDNTMTPRVCVCRSLQSNSAERWFRRLKSYFCLYVNIGVHQKKLFNTWIFLQKGVCRVSLSSKRKDC